MNNGQGFSWLHETHELVRKPYSENVESDLRLLPAKENLTMPETQYPISRRIDSGINPISAKELIRHLQNAIERLECFTDGENDEVYPIISMSADMPHSIRTSHDGRHESLIFEIHVFDNVKTYIELRGM